MVEVDLYTADEGEGGGGEVPIIQLGVEAAAGQWVGWRPRNSLKY